MKQTVFFGSLLSVIFLLLGTYVFPTDIIMWFASTSWIFTVLRLLMAVVLILVLCTTPPRELYMRLAMGAAALISLGAGVGIAMSDSLHVLDIILFIQLGIVLGLEALEFNEDELAEKTRTLQKQYAVGHAPSSLERNQQLLRNLIIQTHFQKAALKS